MDVAENTICNYFEPYQEAAIDKLKEINYYQPGSELKEHLVSLEAYFREHPPATIKQAQSDVEVITGIKRIESQVREFLKKIHLRCQKRRHACGQS